jgi:hypothetical protein
MHSYNLEQLVLKRFQNPANEKTMPPPDPHSDFGISQLALFVVAAMILLVFVWIYIR